MPVNDSKKIVERDENGRLKPGSVLNPAGKPKGTDSFKTKWYKAISKIADKDGITTDEIEQELLLVGLNKAKDGDYQFYKDVFDRVYGKAQQNLDVTTDGSALMIPTGLTVIEQETITKQLKQGYEQGKGTSSSS